MAQHRPKSRLRHNLEQAAMGRLAWLVGALARHMSLATVRRLADAAAWLVMALAPGRVRLAEANISASFPEFTPAEVSAVRKGSVRNICRTMMELLKLPSLTDEQILAITDTSQLSPILETLGSSRGMLVITAHFGNWEWLGATWGALGHTITVVARDAAHGLTARVINDSRAAHSMQVVGRDDLRVMLSVLRDGQALGILPDQHALEGGVLLDFLGRPAWTFTGPALLAMRTGARVFPVGCPRLPDGAFRIEVLPELTMVATGDREADLLANTRLVNGALEELIRRHPEQWLWLHNRWKQHAGQPQPGEADG